MFGKSCCWHIDNPIRFFQMLWVLLPQLCFSYISDSIYLKILFHLTSKYLECHYLTIYTVTIICCWNYLLPASTLASLQFTHHTAAKLILWKVNQDHAISLQSCNCTNSHSEENLTFFTQAMSSAIICLPVISLTLCCTLSSFTHSRHISFWLLLEPVKHIFTLDFFVLTVSSARNVLFSNVHIYYFFTSLPVLQFSSWIVFTISLYLKQFIHASPHHSIFT